MRGLLLLLSLVWGAHLSAQPLKIGVSVADLGNPFFATLADTIGTVAREARGEPVDLRVRSSAYDLDRQLGQLQAFIDARVDIIILTAADSEAVAPAVKRAQQAGIVVAAVDINARGADLTVTTDNVQAGEIACEHMVRRLANTGLVAIVNGARVSSVTDRVAGCRSVLNDYPEVRLLSDEYNGGGTYSGGLEAMTYLINAYPELDAVFAINDPSALGAVNAVRLSGQENLFIVSVDGSPEGVEALLEEDAILAATAAQFPRAMARRAVLESLRLLEQRRSDSLVIRIPTRLVTERNAHQFTGWNGQLPMD